MRQRISAILAVLGLLVATSALAQSKPAVAVLGLEVIDEGTGIDPQTTQMAKTLTQALRDRTRLQNSPYRLAPNSEKGLLELKLLSGCADEARNCMAAIGRDLGAQWLIFGKIEKRDTGYQVTLKLLNVETMAMERVTTELIPFADNNGPAITNKWSRALFNRLTGIPEQGNLAVQANVSRGRVFVDGQMATTLRQGRARIHGLAEGKHPVAIEAEGHERYETTVEIAAGETVELDAQLQSAAVAQPDAPPGGGDGEEAGRPGGTARVLFWTTAAVTVASTAGFTISALQVRSAQADKDDLVAALEPYGEMYQSLKTAIPNCDTIPSAAALSGHVSDEMDRADVEGYVNDYRTACEKGQSASLRTFILGPLAVAGALAAGYFYYQGYLATDAGSGSERAAGKSGRQAPTVQITPTITPDYFGAGVRIEF